MCWKSLLHYFGKNLTIHKNRNVTKIYLQNKKLCVVLLSSKNRRGISIDENIAKLAKEPIFLLQKSIIVYNRYNSINIENFSE